MKSRGRPKNSPLSNQKVKLRYLAEWDHYDLHQRPVSERLRSLQSHHSLAVLGAAAHLRVSTHQISPTGNCRIKGHRCKGCLLAVITHSDFQRDQVFSPLGLSHMYLKIILTKKLREDRCLQDLATLLRSWSSQTLVILPQWGAGSCSLEAGD